MIPGIAALVHGSPLRGQGTPLGSRAPYSFGRFTPARAGNTGASPRRPSPPPVHPCAGREHVSVSTPVPSSSGSPLRGQGTPTARPYHRAHQRFTPARAGNTFATNSSSPSKPVHPCAGREHTMPGRTCRIWIGSPLRGQGTRGLRARRIALQRFTPARAGNTAEFYEWRPLAPVHPCAGREHTSLTNRSIPWTGSPLRGQGTPDNIAVCWLQGRFTPARAGNTAG